MKFYFLKTILSHAYSKMFDSSKSLKFFANKKLKIFARKREDFLHMIQRKLKTIDLQSIMFINYIKIVLNRFNQDFCKSRFSVSFGFFNFSLVMSMILFKKL